jgi:hypothetical protein
MCGCVLMIIREIKERVKPSRPFSSIDSGYTTSQWDLGMGIGYTQAQDQSATLVKSTSGMRDDIFHRWLIVLDVL